MAKAQQSFEMLPSELRNRFNNSIPKFLAFIADPSNREEATNMGFYDKKVVPPVGAKPADSSPVGTPGPVSNVDTVKK